MNEIRILDPQQTAKERARSTPHEGPFTQWVASGPDRSKYITQEDDSIVPYLSLDEVHSDWRRAGQSLVSRFLEDHTQISEPHRERITTAIVSLVDSLQSSEVILDQKRVLIDELKKRRKRIQKFLEEDRSFLKSEAMFEDLNRRRFHGGDPHADSVCRLEKELRDRIELIDDDIRVLQQKGKIQRWTRTRDILITRIVFLWRESTQGQLSQTAIIERIAGDHQRGLFHLLGSPLSDISQHDIKNALKRRDRRWDPDRIHWQ